MPVYHLDKAMDTLDIGTTLTLDVIWKEMVAESITNSLSTGKTTSNNHDDDWEIVQHTAITEPFWGIVVNK